MPFFPFFVTVVPLPQNVVCELLGKLKGNHQSKFGEAR